MAASIHIEDGGRLQGKTSILASPKKSVKKAEAALEGETEQGVGGEES